MIFINRQQITADGKNNLIISFFITLNFLIYIVFFVILVNVYTLNSGEADRFFFGREGRIYLFYNIQSEFDRVHSDDESDRVNSFFSFVYLSGFGNRIQVVPLKHRSIVFFIL